MKRKSIQLALYSVLLLILTVSGCDDEAVKDKKTKAETSLSNLPEMELIVQFNLSIDSQNYNQAVMLTNEMLKRTPDNYDVLAMRGMALVLLGRIEEADKDFQACIALDAKVGNKVRSAAVYALMRQARDASMQGDNKFAIKQLDGVLLMYPESGIAYHERGAEKIETKDYKGAVLDFTKAIKYDKGHNRFGDSYLLRSRAKDALGDKEGAKTDRLLAQKLSGMTDTRTPINTIREDKTAKVDLKAEKEKKLIYGGTALSDAAINGQTDLIRQLLEKGGKIETKNKNSCTALHSAAVYGKTDVIRLLLEKGAKIEAKGKNDATPLHYAASYGQIEAMKFLLEKGAKIEALEKWKNTPLHCAAVRGHTESVKLLLEKGANIEAQNSQGMSPLNFAAESGQSNAIKLLLEKGAKIEAKDERSNTSLHFAAAHGKTAALKILLEKGAKIEAKDKYGYTPMHKAAWNGRTSAVMLLLKKGAKIEAKNKYGRTPLHLAAQGGNTATIRVFLEKGANKNVKDQDGETALSFAIVYGHKEAAKLLE